MHRLGAVVPLASLAACSPHAVEPHSVPPAGEPVEYAKPKRLQDEAFTFRGLPVVHSVPTEQAQLTLLPIYVEFPPEAGITRAVVNVRPPEEDSYSYVLMRKSGKGFAVELPCIAVYRVGTLRLFITGTFERSDGFQVTVGSLGSNSNPFLVYIKPTITGPPPALPGREPSKKCQCHDCGVPGYLLGSGNDESGR